MQKKDIKDLLNRVESGLATPQEEEVAQFWLHHLNEQACSDLTDDDLLQARGSMWQKINTGKHAKIYPFKIRRWMAAAAATVLLCLSMGGYFLYRQIAPGHMAQSLRFKNDLAPGGNKALLTLANGQQIILSDAKNGTLVNQGNITVTKTADGQIVYRAAAELGGKVAGAAVGINTITTPRGGQYQVVLPDDSHVWLNAASSLSYPTAFTGTERRVKLTGEAYFEVAKNKQMPFKVESQGQQVEVLGTHFNISAYADDAGTKTTLLEGSVRLNNQVVLKPGEQATMQPGATTDVSAVNTDDAIAWKNGKFKFENENIKDLMRKVARWYDVQVDYEGGMSRQNFSGSVSRFDSISKLLNILESTNTVHFKIEGRRITVMP